MWLFNLKKSCFLCLMLIHAYVILSGSFPRLYEESHKKVLSVVAHDDINQIYIFEDTVFASDQKFNIVYKLYLDIFNFYIHVLLYCSAKFRIVKTMS